MRAVGRNDPCPCGSGRKHKVCCLDAGRTALRLAAQLEDRILELGSEARQEHPAAWKAQFEQNIGPLNKLGTVSADEAAWLDTWLVCHAPIIDECTPVEATTTVSAVDAQLRDSSICGWWARSNEFPVAATHWRFEEPVTLHSRHDPFGTLTEGALVIARGSDTGSGHVALVGQPVVVHEDAVGDVLALLHRAPDQALCAALRWPEERTHTAHGELVQHCFRRYELSDPDAAIALLRSTKGITEQTDVVTYWEDDVQFEIAGPAIAGTVTPPDEPGVRWELCKEDTTDPPQLGEIVICPSERELELNAATHDRAQRLVTALPAELRDSLGEMTQDELDMPDVMSRISRVRITQLLTARRT
ncbi:MAG: YecA family protein [Solirubrobacteraceae bacterium]